MNEWMIIVIIAMGAFAAVAHSIQADGYNRLAKLAMEERKDLLDRIQASTLKEYKTLSVPIEPREPAEPKERVTQL